MGKKRFKIKAEYIWTGLSALVAVISLIVSIKSCDLSKDGIEIAQNSTRIANDSNRLAEEALQNAKHNFITEQRPWLTLTPKRFKDSGTFLKISNTTTTFTIKSQIEIRNIGKVPARNIHLPSKAISGINLTPGAHPVFTIPPNTTLAPDDSFILSGTCTLMQTESDLKETLKLWESSDANIDLIIPCFYTSELEPSKEYKTKVYFKFFMDSINRLFYEME
ncbi:MAG: hypothetical protein ABIH45_06720 [Candidatus Omnitrophota bacterium]